MRNLINNKAYINVRMSANKNPFTARFIGADPLKVFKKNHCGDLLKAGSEMLAMERRGRSYFVVDLTAYVLV